MRKEDLREVIKRAVERDAHKLKTRLSQREKRKHKGDGGGGLQHRAAGAHIRIHQGGGKLEGGSTPQPAVGERRARKGWP